MVIGEPLSYAYEQAKIIDVGIVVNKKITPRKKYQNKDGKILRHSISLSHKNNSST